MMKRYMAYAHTCHKYGKTPMKFRQWMGYREARAKTKHVVWMNSYGEGNVND